MLVLSRKVNESIQILLPGNQIIRVVVTKFQKGQVSLGFIAPQEIRIYREELLHGESESGESATPPTIR